MGTADVFEMLKTADEAPQTFCVPYDPIVVELTAFLYGGLDHADKAVSQPGWSSDALSRAERHTEKYLRRYIRPDPAEDSLSQRAERYRGGSAGGAAIRRERLLRLEHRMVDELEHRAASAGPLSSALSSRIRIAVATSIMILHRSVLPAFDLELERILR